MNLRYFVDEEFRKAQPSCSLSDMSPKLMVMLDQAREFAGVPFKINSAFRTVDYEKSKGRKGSSRHCFGEAVDIACYTNNYRFRIVNALLAVGFKRIGIGKTFIHCDVGYPDAEPIVWLY